MANKNNRKADKARQRKQLEKQRAKLDARKGKRPSASIGATLRQSNRLARQKPQAWPSELEADVAVFDTQVRETLPAEVAEQATAVHEAIQLISQGHFTTAVERVSQILRSSPLSQWRLFVRGLAVWTETSDVPAAREIWNRLEGQRRPGRIAMALLAAHRTDLETLKAEQETPEPHVVGDAPALDSTLLYGAKLIRRTKLDRKSIVHARQFTSQRDEDSSLRIGPKKIAELRHFSAQYKDLEPHLVRALQQAALHRAYIQNYGNLYEQVTQVFPGPAHDPRNSLLSFFFYEDEKADRYLRLYLTRDLPANQQISEKLRAALISQIHLLEANSKLQMQQAYPFRFSLPSVSNKEIEADFQSAIKAYPTNLQAHKDYVEFIRRSLEDPNATKAELKKPLAAMEQAMVAWSAAMPNEIEPRLWLVDHFLEAEDLEQAKPHVDWLSGSRHDDPRVRATPWKWEILETFRLCRRKTWLNEAEAHLTEVEASWPKWLRRDWFPYLEAALLLRRGDTAAYEEKREALCKAQGITRDGLSDACMMLATAQHMRVPAATLKPLRVPVDSALKRLAKLTLEELIAVGNFFWDLHRTSLVYPAYRMHGAKLAGEFLKRVKAGGSTITSKLNDDQFQNAVLWLAAHRFLMSHYDFEMPPVLQRAAKQTPKYAAAEIHTLLQGSTTWRYSKFTASRKMLEEAAPTESDPYYRYWFAALVKAFDEALEDSDSSSGMFGAFARMFGEGRFSAFDDEDEDEDDDEEDEDEDDDEEDDDEYYLDDSDYDAGCHCPDCTAARKAAARKAAGYT